MKTLTAHLLCGDIGATKTTLALYNLNDSPASLPVKQQTYQNANFSQFDDVLAVFLGTGSNIPQYACLGIAGPVIDGRARMTNLKWQLDEQELERRHGFLKVHLINDLVATAMGITNLKSHDVRPINVGSAKQTTSVMAVLAPGSGLGEAFLIPQGRTYHPCASEGGHSTFAPRNEEQIELLEYLLRHQSHVSVEQVCSGLAIPTLFSFMSIRHTVPVWLQEEIEDATDPTPVIIEAAVRAAEGKRVCGVALQTMHLFCDILADEAANLALKTLSLGGIYLAGGLTPRLSPFLQPERFMQFFIRGDFADILSRIPVYVVLNDQTALRGAASYGFHSFTTKNTWAHTSSQPSHLPQ